MHLHATYDSREITPVSVLPRSQWDSCPAGGGTQCLPRLLPFGKAFEMVLMGKRISAEEAFRLNLVSSVVHAAELMPTAREWATRISELDPKAVQSVKKALLEGSSMSLNDGLS